MKILIDLQGAQNSSRFRGIGRYSQALSKAIVRNAKDHTVFILLNGLFPDSIDDIINSFSSILPKENFIIFKTPGPVDELNSENAWRVQIGELLREYVINLISPDMILISSLFEGACDNTLGSVGYLNSNIPTSIILYDLIPLLDPEKYIGWAPAAAWYYRKIESLKRADLLLAISESAGNEAKEHLKIESEKIVEILSAADESFTSSKHKTRNTSAVLEKFKIVKKFLMHSSAFDERKNFEGLIKAFSLIPKKIRENFQLVLVCKLDTNSEEKLIHVAKEHGLQNDELILTNFVTDEELITLYSSCYLFVFPSFHEGFGLPALEAMSCGTPVIGSNTSSIPEVIGRYDALFDPYSAEDMARLIEKAITDHDFRNALTKHAEKQSKKFSWDYSAQVAISAFEKFNNRPNKGLKKLIHSNLYYELINKIRRIIDKYSISDDEIIEVAECIDNLEKNSIGIKSNASYVGRLKWRIEGPFDSSYSLALLNRETARALVNLGHDVILHSTEGPGDFEPNPYFLDMNTDLRELHTKVNDNPHTMVDIVSRNLYPPRVHDMHSKFNLLHHYAWEESGFPREWVDEFNTHLDGMTCLSEHVEKIMIDNGVNIPLSVSGCGVDHWEKIIASDTYKLEAKKFRFLHVSSCFPRKGVDALLDAYGKSFTDKDDVSLIIKTFKNPHNNIYNWLNERKSNNPNYPDVIIIEDDLHEEVLKSLYQQCDVLVSPSKAEGFGLPMAEAILSGLPIITTGWGGQLDFCNNETAWLVDYKFGKAQSHFNLHSSTWAEIDVDDLAEKLKESFLAPESIRKQKVIAGKNVLLGNYTWKNVTERAVDSTIKWRDFTDSEPTPRIGWISTWNTKCGIATYSEHLLSFLPSDVLVLAPKSIETIKEDKENCIRCWSQGKEGNEFNELSDQINKSNLNTLIIQFNYGFFDFHGLNDFIHEQANQGRVIIIMMHSTVDPFGITKNWNLSELKDSLSKCDRILVHSINDLNRLKSIGLVNNVCIFPHGILNYEDEITENSNSIIPLIATYGFCLPHKGLLEVVQAIEELNKSASPVRLRLVNAEFPDPSSTNLVNEIKSYVKDNNLTNLVEFETRFLTDQESLNLLKDADLLVFAYQNTGESASGAARYGLATGKPVAVTPLDIFSDLGESVFRFEANSPQEIASGIKKFLHAINNKEPQAECIKENAKKWRDFHDYNHLAKRLFNINIALLRKKISRIHYYDGSSPYLFSEVGDRTGREIKSSGKAGYLLYGPYVETKKGIYNIEFCGNLYGNKTSPTVFEVVALQGKMALAHYEINDFKQQNLFSFEVKLDVDVQDLEVRIWTGNESHASISYLCIRQKI